MDRTRERIALIEDKEVPLVRFFTYVLQLHGENGSTGPSFSFRV